jgi:hypothetical protein
MADITIDGKKYDASDMNEEQLPIAQKLTQLVNTENNLKSQLLDIGILKDVYIQKFKELDKK